MKFETKTVHAGYTPGPQGRAGAVPIFQTAAYSFDDSQYAEDLFSLATLDGHVYSRMRNPTTGVLEQRVAALEGGVAAVALGSGQAAVVCSVLNLAQSGDNIVSASHLYGGSFNLFERTLPSLGVGVRFAVGDSAMEFERLIDRNTKAIFCESYSNPSCDVADIALLAEVAHANGVPLIVDNTLPSPYLCRPIEHEADIVVHSLTKYLGGHGNLIGGIVVDSGKFQWKEHAARFPHLTESDPAYGGTRFTETFGTTAYAARLRLVMLRNMGPALSPFNSFLALQGIETLPVRVDRICESALKIARHLDSHPAVAWVRYAGLESHPDNKRLIRYMGGRAPGILGFGPMGGKAAGLKFQDALLLILRMANLGDTRSMAIHPASTTHRQLSSTQLERAGVTDDMIRLSIGLEHVDDLLEDIDRALTAAA